MAGRRSPTSLSRSASPDRRSRLQSVLDDYLTREQLRNMIVETGIAADEEHLLDRIFQDLDPNGFGRISRRELWEELDRFLPSGEEELRRQDPMPRSMKPRLPSSPSPAALPEPRYQSPKSASGHPLGSQAWELLHRIYGRLAGPDVKVSTIALIQEIRQDVHVRNEGLLERPVVGIGFGPGPSISLDAALQHVLRQVSGEHSLLEFTTWERFNWLLLEAQRFCQMAEVSPRQTEPWHHAGRVRRPSLPSPRGNGWSQILSAGGSSMSSCPNPDEEPGGAIECHPQNFQISSLQLVSQVLLVGNLYQFVICLMSGGWRNISASVETYYTACSTCSDKGQQKHQSWLVAIDLYRWCRLAHGCNRHC